MPGCIPKSLYQIGPDHGNYYNYQQFVSYFYDLTLLLAVMCGFQQTSTTIFKKKKHLLFHQQAINMFYAVNRVAKQAHL